MAVIVVTRLRLKDPALLDDFFTDALAAIEQAQKSDGNLGVDALADANNAWWSVTSWQERRLMQSYVRTEPHRCAQDRHARQELCERMPLATNSDSSCPAQAGHPVFTDSTKVRAQAEM